MIPRCPSWTWDEDASHLALCTGVGTPVQTLTGDVARLVCDALSWVVSQQSARMYPPDPDPGCHDVERLRDALDAAEDALSRAVVASRALREEL